MNFQHRKLLFAYQSEWLWHITVIATMYIHGLPDMYTVSPRALGVCAYQASQLCPWYNYDIRIDAHLYIYIYMLLKHVLTYV